MVSCSKELISKYKGGGGDRGIETGMETDTNIYLISVDVDITWREANGQIIFVFVHPDDQNLWLNIFLKSIYKKSNTFQPLSWLE